MSSRPARPLHLARKRKLQKPQWYRSRKVQEYKSYKLGSTAKKFVGVFVRSSCRVCVRAVLQPFVDPIRIAQNARSKSKCRIAIRTQRAHSSGAVSMLTPLMPPTMLSGTQGPLSSLVAECRASARLKV